MHKSWFEGAQLLQFFPSWIQAYLKQWLLLVQEQHLGILSETPEDFGVVTTGFTRSERIRTRTQNLPPF